MIEFLGDEKDGGWHTETSGLNAESVVYSFGQGDNISWDLAMIRRFGCKIYAFDPDPKSIAWLSTQDLPPNYVFRPVGISNSDGFLRFYHAFKPGKVNSSIMRKNKSFDSLPVKRLATLMKELGHDHIDILKMDIEGAEFKVIPDIVNLDIRQMLFESHERFFTGWKGLRQLYGSFKTKQLFRRLKNAGFEIGKARSLGDGSKDCDYLMLKKPEESAR